MGMKIEKDKNTIKQMVTLYCRHKLNMTKPTEPIMPGTTGKVKVVYNAANPAPFTKDVYIKLAGIDAQKIVHITGEVLTAEAFEAYKKEKKPATQQQPQAATAKPAATTGQPKFTTASGN